MSQFQPTLRVALFAIVVAVFGFMFPQDIPIEYYSLDLHSSGLQYLEITCASDFSGLMVVYLDRGRGFNDVDIIKWPIGPSEALLTYRFPLANRPLYRLRISTEQASGILYISNFKIINRIGQEIHNIKGGEFNTLHKMLRLVTTPNGTKISGIDKDMKYLCNVNFRNPIVPSGMNQRNFKKCLISWIYLSIMICISSLAVYVTFIKSEPLLLKIKYLIFLAFVSLLFSAVGNRGIIKNSINCYIFESSCFELTAPGL